MSFSLTCNGVNIHVFGLYVVQRGSSAYIEVHKKEFSIVTALIPEIFMT